MTIDLEKYRGLIGGAAALTFVVVGVVLGAALSWALLLRAPEAAAPWVDVVVRDLASALAICAGLLAVVVPISRTFFINAKRALDNVLVELSAARRARGGGDATVANVHLERAALEALAWYTPRAARYWVVKTSFALLLALGGLAGTALVFRQTVLLKEQNAKLGEQTALLRDQNFKLDLQTVAAETAQLRSMLAPELFSLIQTISGQAGKPLEAPTIRRIEAFSQSAIPYFSLDVENSSAGRAVVLSKVQRSNERGQLLYALAASRYTPPERAIFDFSNLRAARLSFAAFDGVKLNHADLGDADLTYANLENATLLHTNFSMANMKGANLRNAELFSNNFALADLSGATLANAKGPKSLGLYNLDFRGATLYGTDLSGTNFGESTNWEDAIVGRESTGPLPDGFPKGWVAPPSGWTSVTENGLVTLKRAVPISSAN